MADTPAFSTREEVDFVVIGSGSAGGIIAKELATAGHKVVVLEQGPYRKNTDFDHDELGVLFRNELKGGGTNINGQTFRSDESKTAIRPDTAPADYAQSVGGSSVHYSAHFLRMRADEFQERSLLGPIAGTNFADWPITYAELEPYYAKVDWDIGVSGAPGHFDSPRSRPFPMPPMAVNSSGALLIKAASKLGLHADVQPHAILTEPYNNRAPCIKCGYCMFFGCEVGAKSSTLVTMIPLAEASGNCEIRAECAAFRIETDAAGKASEVLYFDPDGNERGQKTRAVVLSANGAESPRMLLMSSSERHPDGLANSSGFVGRNLMFNPHGGAQGTFEHPLNEYKGVQSTRIVQDYHDSDPDRGYYNGGIIDSRALFSATPIFHAVAGMNPAIRPWGAEYKDEIGRSFTRQMSLALGGNSLPLDRNNITLDPTSTDSWGRPALRVTYREHEDALENVRYLTDRCMEIMDAAGAQTSWSSPVNPMESSPHLLGTCRMGDDPATSVVDKYHRSHDVKNLFICDGSSMVSSTRGQPTMTIMALAFRAADAINEAAATGDV